MRCDALSGRIEALVVWSRQLGQHALGARLVEGEGLQGAVPGDGSRRNLIGVKSTKCCFLYATTWEACQKGVCGEAVLCVGLPEVYMWGREKRNRNSNPHLIQTTKRSPIPGNCLRLFPGATEETQCLKVHVGHLMVSLVSASVPLRSNAN